MTNYTVNKYQSFVFNYPYTGVLLHINGLPPNVSFYLLGGSYKFEVDVITTVGVFNYNVLNSANVVVDTIQLTVNNVNPSQSFNLCLGDINKIFSLPAPPSGSWVYSDNYYPSFINISPFGFGLVTVGIASKIGEFNLLFQSTASPLTQVHLIRITVKSCLVERCKCTGLNECVVWLNPSGGWSSYCFKGKKTYGVNINNTKNFKTSKGEVRHYSRTDIYDSLLVLSGEIPVSDAPNVKTLKYAIQAYLLRVNGYVPIIIEEKDFELFTDKDGLMRYNIDCYLSNEIVIQTG